MDITIIGGEMFKQVATVAKLGIFKQSDNIPHNFDQQLYR